MKFSCYPLLFWKQSTDVISKWNILLTLNSFAGGEGGHECLSLTLPTLLLSLWPSQMLGLLMNCFSSFRSWNTFFHLQKNPRFCLSSEPVAIISFVQIFFQALLSFHLNLKDSFLCILNVISSSFLAGAKVYLVLCGFLFGLFKYSLKTWPLGCGGFCLFGCL